MELNKEFEIEVREKIKRVVITSNYNDFKIPSMFEEEIKVILKESSRNTRIVLAELMDNLEINYNDEFSDPVDLMNKLSLDYLRNDNDFYFKVSDFQCLELSIVEVDSSRPWVIKCYDGLESIIYLDDYKLIDEELNLYELCECKEYFN